MAGESQFLFYKMRLVTKRSPSECLPLNATVHVFIIGDAQRLYHGGGQTGCQAHQDPSWSTEVGSGWGLSTPSLCVLLGLEAEECGNRQSPPGRSPRVDVALLTTFTFPSVRTSGTYLMLCKQHASHYPSTWCACYLGQNVLSSECLHRVHCCREYTAPCTSPWTFGRDLPKISRTPGEGSVGHAQRPWPHL